MKIDPKLNKWLKWLEIIQSEIYDLVVSKDIFWQVQNLIKDNKQIQKPSIFYRHLGDTYVSHILIGIRRQIKYDQNSISFIRLLKEIEENPQIITRDYFTSLYSDSIVKDLADTDFDKYSGNDPSYISPIFVKKDLKKLKEITLKCEAFADRRVAHRDKRDPNHILKFDDINNCVDFLDKLYCQYHLIFHADYSDSLKPTYQYDWKAIFDFPWRTKSTTTQQPKHI